MNNGLLDLSFLKQKKKKGLINENGTMDLLYKKPDK